ncbi:MAG: citrate synthase [Lachnospiraceae bacterium]
MVNSFIAQSYGRSRNYTLIENQLFKEYDVKKGLRNEDGTGVRVGLTRVSDVVGYDIVDGKKVSIPGELYYRGYRVNDLVMGKGKSHRGYEEVCFLLLFGYLPDKAELRQFCKVLGSMYELPKEFLEMHLLRMPSKNLMNCMQQSVLSLYDYDPVPDDTDAYHTVMKGLNILAKLPSILCYSYQSMRHSYHKDSLFIHYARKDYSIAENILYMLRPDRNFTEKEANLLDVLLMLHADHGGGNNSTFTNVVISSTGTDLYSSVVGSIGSLKGPKHGGANVRCAEMMSAVIKEIGYDADDKAIKKIIKRILDKDFYDGSGLVYGMGHAVYTITDPRADILEICCRDLAKEQKREREFAFMSRFDRIARETVTEKTGKSISNNVDFYSGFAYEMLQIPQEMYTPLFTTSRMVGWLSHNIENKLYDGRIMRPATKYIGKIEDYKKMEDR